MMLISIVCDGCGFPGGIFIWLDWLLYQDLYLLEQVPCTTIIVSINLQHIYYGSITSFSVYRGPLRCSASFVCERFLPVLLCLQEDWRFWGWGGLVEQHCINVNPSADVFKSQILFHDDCLHNGDIQKSKAASSPVYGFGSLKSH